MSAKHSHQREPLRVWLSGLAVTLTAVVSYMAFWHLSPGLTFMVAVGALVASMVAAWHYGRTARLDREREKEPGRQNARDA